jgi:hypothetical protein
MADVTVQEITDGIATTLEAAAGIELSQSEDEITEGANVVPVVQVYWFGFNKTPTSDTHQFTFGDSTVTPIYVTEHTFHVDVLARQRSVIDLDLTAVAETAVAIDAVLEAEVAEPLFGVAGIKAFDYEAEFVTIQEGEGADARLFMGERFTLTVTLF